MDSKHRCQCAYRGCGMCDLLASTCCTVYLQVGGSLWPLFPVMYSISGCVVGELKCPLLTVLTLDHSLLIWKRGSSLCDQMYGFLLSTRLLKSFLSSNTTGNWCPKVKKSSKVNTCPKIPRGSCSGRLILHCDGFFKPTEATRVLRLTKGMSESFQPLPGCRPDLQFD